MNPFETHGIGHLSPSSLNLFIAQPGIWALRYLARRKEAGNVRMWRGTAVEAGFVHYLHAGKLREAYDAAHRSFALNVEENGEQGEAADKERALLEPMLNQALLWTPPSALNASQIKVEHWFDDVPVPVIGYVDLAFDGIDVDLKTTMRCPSKPDPTHVRQVSLYRAARKREGRLLYVTDKRYAYYAVDDEMMATALEELNDAARKLSKLLGAFKTADDVMAALPIDYSSYMAPKVRVDARMTASASADFEAVELEA